MYPNARNGKYKTIYGANERCMSLMQSLGITIYYKIVDNQKSYPLTKSGKRDVKKLVEEGLTKECFVPVYENEEYKAEYSSFPADSSVLHCFNVCCLHSCTRNLSCIYNAVSVCGCNATGVDTSGCSSFCTF